VTFIADQSALDAFCVGLRGAPYVAVDTEFLRDKTYWPQLCLVQLAGAGQAAAIDPLAEGIDLTPVFEILADPGTVKVFHAARQDLEIFMMQTGRLPAPLFDTQVAAMACGFGEQVAYDTLAAKLAGAKLDKSSRFTNWTHRPLSEAQLTYALSDVTHLCVIYEKLRRRLERTARDAWLAEEMAQLTDPALYRADPAEAWLRLKPRGASSRFLVVLRELASWRETEAQRRNVPRNRIVRDEQLLEIAAQTPRDIEALARLRSVGRGVAESRFGGELVACVERALARPREEWPEPERREDPAPGRAAVVELLRVLLKAKCDQHGVAQKLVASAADLDMIAGADDARVPALRGWRREVFGEDALALKKGRLALAIDGARVRAVPVPVPASTEPN
jgi:ribonuclease D